MITDDSVVDAGGFEDPRGLKFGRFVGIRIVLAKLGVSLIFAQTARSPGIACKRQLMSISSFSLDVKPIKGFTAN